MLAEYYFSGWFLCYYFFSADRRTSQEHIGLNEDIQGVSESYKIPGSIKQKRTNSLIQSCIHKHNNFIVKKILSLIAMVDCIPEGKIAPEVARVQQKGSSTFSFEGKIAQLAYIRPDISVSADMFFEHAWLFAANATFFTNVLSSATTSDIDIILIWFIPVGREQVFKSYTL